MINVISLFHGLDVVNINVYAKVYQNIPNGLRVIDIRELSGDKIFANCPVTKNQMFDYKAHSECQPSVSVAFLRVMQRTRNKLRVCNNNMQKRVLLWPSVDINVLRFASGIIIDLGPQQMLNTLNT